MFKKVFIAMAAMSLAVQPFVPSMVRAGSGSWSNLQATAAWVYDDYKIERLDLGGDITTEPLSLGDNVVIGKRSGQCDYVSNCDRYDLYSLKNGMTMFLGNVPRETLNEERFLDNNEDFVYVNSADDSGTRWQVIDLDLASGEENILLDSVFIDGVQDIDVVKADEEYYFNPSLNWNDHNGFVNAVIYQYDQAGKDVKMVTNHYNQQNDDLQDIYEGKILSKVTFDSGYKQLWVYDTVADPRSMSAVPETWTAKDEDILGAHFRADGTIEFFSMYQRYIYDGETTSAQSDYLSWYRAHEEALQVVNGRMAWLDPTDGLHVSGADVELDLGTIGYPANFKLTDTAIYYSSGLEGKMYEFATGELATFPFAVTDELDGAVVGQDYNGDIWYANLDSGRELKLGFGSNAVISDEMHVYWLGADTQVYEATLSLHAMTGTSEIQAVKVAGSPHIYVVLDDTVYWIKNEKIYFSWFESWDDIKTISATTLGSHQEGGEATYAPGTRLKLSGDPKVYMVGSDGKLHWLTTQLIAYNVFGQDWNKGIVEFNNAETTDLLFGSAVEDEVDAQSI